MMNQPMHNGRRKTAPRQKTSLPGAFLWGLCQLVKLVIKDQLLFV
jgi:hypothetical protein